MLSLCNRDPKKNNSCLVFATFCIVISVGRWQSRARTSGPLVWTVSERTSGFNKTSIFKTRIWSYVESHKNKLTGRQIVRLKWDKCFTNIVNRAVTSSCINSTHAYQDGTPQVRSFCSLRFADHRSLVVRCRFSARNHRPSVSAWKKLTGLLSNQARDHNSLATSSPLVETVVQS